MHVHAAEGRRALEPEGLAGVGLPARAVRRTIAVVEAGGERGRPGLAARREVHHPSLRSLEAPGPAEEQSDAGCGSGERRSSRAPAEREPAELKRLGYMEQQLENEVVAKTPAESRSGRKNNRNGGVCATRRSWTLAKQRHRARLGVKRGVSGTGCEV